MALLMPSEDQPYVTKASTYNVCKSAVGKSYVFQIDVEWSNGTTTICHRPYADFFTFQCELLDLNPDEAGQTKGSTRTIPYLPGKSIFSVSSMRLALERLPMINEYVDKLVALPPHISRSPLVTKFFTSNWLEDSMRLGLKEAPATADTAAQHAPNPPTFAPFFPVSFKNLENDVEAESDL